MLAILDVRSSPARKKKKKLKRRFCDFRQKEETGRKGISASQLAITNFNDITGKHMNTPCAVAFFAWFF